MSFVSGLPRQRRTRGAWIDLNAVKPTSQSGKSPSSNAFGELIEASVSSGRLRAGRHAEAVRLRLMLTVSHSGAATEPGPAARAASLRADRRGTRGIDEFKTIAIRSTLLPVPSTVSSRLWNVLWQTAGEHLDLHQPDLCAKALHLRLRSSAKTVIGADQDVGGAVRRFTRESRRHDRDNLRTAEM